MRKMLHAAVVFLCMAGIAKAEDMTKFVVELGPHIDATDNILMPSYGVKEVESFTADTKSWAVLEAASEKALLTYLSAIGVQPGSILPVNFINSPTVGGGVQAGESPRHGHKIYVIERPIPGVGDFPLERKQMISQRSNASIDMLGDKIEWQRSYLTSEGTYCVYRAVDEDAIREHGKLAEAPIATVTAVEQTNPERRLMEKALLENGRLFNDRSMLLSVEPCWNYEPSAHDHASAVNDPLTAEVLEALRSTLEVDRRSPRHSASGRGD
jgi:hypothetical protein